MTNASQRHSYPGALPKYVQISEMLIRDIAAGRLADGARLPPEREMAASLGIAVGTLRRALQTLEDKGLLTRIHGSGNYVQTRADVSSVYSFLRLERIGGGGLPTAEVLSIEWSSAPRNAPFNEGLRFRRLRYMDQIPAALEEIWLDGSITQHVDEAAISESLYLYYSKALGIVITAAEDRVSTGIIPSWTDPRFGLTAGETCGYIERIGQTGSGQQIEYSQTWFDPQQIIYISRLGKG